MTKYKIEVNVKVVECNENVNVKPKKYDDGSFAMVISEEDAISIDKCETSVLRTAYPSIREAVSNHLTQMSKKKPMKRTPMVEK